MCIQWQTDIAVCPGCYHKNLIVTNLYMGRNDQISIIFMVQKDNNSFEAYN